MVLKSVHVNISNALTAIHNMHNAAEV